MTAIARLTRAETRKLLTTRAVPYTILGTAGLSVVSVLTTAAAAGTKGAAPLGTDANVHQMLKLGVVACITMLVLGIVASGGEYRHKTIIPAFLVTPRRSAVVTAKFAATFILGLTVSVTVFGSGIATIIVVLTVHGAHHLPADTSRLVAGSMAAATLFGLIGAALGFITRSTTAAVVAALAWVLIGELAILHTAAPRLARWLPTASAVRLTDVTVHGSGYLSPSSATMALAIYAILLIGTASVFVTRTDV